MTDKRAAIMRRIEAMLRTANPTPQGVNETDAEYQAKLTEAASAATKAKALMAEYDLEETDFILNHSDTDMRRDVILGSVRITNQGEDAFIPEERLNLACDIAEYFDCKPIIQEMAPTADVDTGRAVKGGKFVSMMGFRSDVDGAKGLFTLLTMDLAMAAAKESQKDKRYLRSFGTGYVQEVGSRLRAMKRERTRAQEQTDVGGTSMALVLVKKTDIVKDAFQTMFPQTGSYRGSKFTPDAAGVARGRAAGGKADLGVTKIGGGGNKSLGGG